MGELDELKKLSPEDRIRRLREIEKKKKKELEEAKKLIDNSVGEVIEEDKQRAQIPIPQLKADSFSIIHPGDEEDIFITKRFIRRTERAEEETSEQLAGEQAEMFSLEDTVEREHPGAAKKTESAYQSIMGGLKEDYERLTSYHELAQRYKLTDEQKAAVGEITGRLEYAAQYAERATEISESYQQMGKALRDVASAGMRIAKEVAGDYIKELRDDYDRGSTHPH